MTAHKTGDPITINRLYGRAKGKPLRQGQQGLVDQLLPRIAVPTEGPITAERLFGEPCPLHFEIGFGGGEHLAFRADMLPNPVKIIGGELPIPRKAPECGQHSDEILREVLGYDADRIAEMHEKGVLG